MEDNLTTINLRQSKIKNLSLLGLSCDIFNTEGTLMVLNKKYKTRNGGRVLFKCLDMQDSPRIMDRKLDIVRYLNKSKYRDLEELVIPEFQVHVDDELAGFGMEYVEDSKNLGHVINSDEVSFEKKKNYLIKLGELIDKVDKVEDDSKLFFGDLNEYNFLIDKDDSLKAIDLDSSYIDGLEGITPPSLTYYILRNYVLWSLPQKYKRNNIGIVIPNSDSDLYSYIMIILGLLSNHNMHTERVEVFHEYLSFLEKNGIDSRLVDCFRNIYLDKKNENPREYIGDLDDSITEKTNFYEFQKTYTK